MKKLLLASAVAALSVAAHAAPEIYGRAHLTMDVANLSSETTTTVNGVSTTVKTSNTTRPLLNSVGSRIGFRGNADLGNDLKAIYKLEYGINISDVGAVANTNQFVPRETFLGLEHKQYGTIKAGRLDVIGSDYSDVVLSNALGNDGVNTVGAIYGIAGGRANNSISYTSPKYNDITVSAMYIMDENIAANDTSRAGAIIAAEYEPTNQPYKAAASYSREGKGQDSTDSIMVSGEYTVNPAITVGATYANSKLGRATNREHLVSVGGTYKVIGTPWTAYGKAMLANNVGGASNTAPKAFVAGASYAFNDNARAHLYGSAGIASSNTTVGGVTTKTSARGLGVGAGFQYNF